MGAIILRIVVIIMWVVIASGVLLFIRGGFALHWTWGTLLLTLTIVAVVDNIKI